MQGARGLLGLLVLAACGAEDGAPTLSAPSRYPTPGGVEGLPQGPVQELVVLVLDGWSTQDVTWNPAILPHLTELKGRSIGFEAAVGTPAGAHAGLTALLTGLEPHESGIASVHDPLGARLPSGIAEQAWTHGRRSFLSVHLPHLHPELSGWGPLADQVVAPALDPSALVPADQVAARFEAEWVAQAGEEARVAVLCFSELVREVDVRPEDTIDRLQQTMLPHLERLPRVARALEQGGAAGVAEVAQLVGRARGSAPYLAWREGLRAARLMAVDRAVGRILAACPEAWVLALSLRGAPLAPPAPGPRAVFEPTQVRTPAFLAPVEGRAKGVLPGTWSTARLGALARSLLGGEPLPDASHPVLVGEGLLERFAAFGSTAHVEELARVQTAAWDREGAALVGPEGEELVAPLRDLLARRPRWGWRLHDERPGSSGLEARWHAVQGHLGSTEVVGAGLDGGEIQGVSGRASWSREATLDLWLGHRSQELTLHLEGTLPDRGPWSQGAHALPLDLTVPEDESLDVEVALDSGWARLFLPGSSESATIEVRRFPARGEDPPLDWNADAHVTIERRDPDGLRLTGRAPTLLGVALPPRTHAALVVHLGGVRVPPWHMGNKEARYGSRQHVRLLLRPDQIDGARNPAGLWLERLGPPPALGEPRRVPAEHEALLRLVPPGE